MEAVTEILPFGHWNRFPKSPGIYCIIHLPSGMEYIGSAVNLYNRARSHRNDLKRGRHHCHRLQRIFTKHGSDSLVLLIVEHVTDVQTLTTREQAHIDSRRPVLNTAPLARSILGVKRSAESRAKMSAISKRRYEDPSERAKTSAALRGKKLSPEHRAKCGNAMRGKKHTPEIRAIIAAASKGRKASDVTRSKQSAAQLAIKAARTPAQKQQAVERFRATMARKKA